MDHSYDKLLKLLPLETPPSDLSARINAMIIRRETLRLRAISAFHTFLACAGATVLIISISYWIKAVAYSGFDQYLSMIVSGGSDILNHWQELGLSFVDSIPFTETTFVLAAILILLESLRRISSDVRLYLNRSRSAKLQTA